MRIIAGKYRGRRIAAPPGRAVRPTPDRVREALFAILASGVAGGAAACEGARVVDLFAGTGALGLEALSRGAAHATFIDNQAASLTVIARNADSLGESERITLLARDATRLGVEPAGLACTLAFLDAPYGSGLGDTALAGLASGWLAEGALCVVELGAREALHEPDGFTRVDERRYGTTRVLFLRWRE